MLLILWRRKIKKGWSAEGKFSTDNITRKKVDGKGNKKTLIFFLYNNYALILNGRCQIVFFSVFFLNKLIGVRWTLNRIVYPIFLVHWYNLHSYFLRIHNKEANLLNSYSCGYSYFHKINPNLYQNRYLYRIPMKIFRWSLLILKSKLWN